MPGINFFYLILLATVVSILLREIKLPYAIALVLVGLAVGWLKLMPRAELDPHILFTLFLPPLLFESAIHLKTEELVADWRPIAILAVAGTLISAAVISAFSIYWLGFPLAIALVFGALASSTDPISVIALFKKLGVGRRLSLLMEAESLFNDGVSIVLFSVCMKVIEGGSNSFLDGIGQFIWTTIGGCSVGFAVGYLSSRLTHSFDDHLLEMMITVVVAYGAYILAEHLHLSGVIAVVFAGIVTGNYGLRSGMSEQSQLSIISLWEFGAFFVNSIVFLIVGIEAGHSNLWQAKYTALVAFSIVLLGRAAAVYLLAPVIKLVRGGIPGKWFHLIFWGGVRGALPMALALGLKDDFPLKQEIILATFGAALFSLLIQGLSMGGLVKALALGKAEN